MCFFAFFGPKSGRPPPARANLLGTSATRPQVRAARLRASPGPPVNFSSYAPMLLGRMQTTRSHHAGPGLRRQPSSKGARMPMLGATCTTQSKHPGPNRFRFARRLLHGHAEISLRNTAPSPRACRPNGVCILAAAQCSRCRCRCRGSPAAEGLPRLTVEPALISPVMANVQ